MSLWYYRRRYPQDVAKVLGKPIYMQSLKTTVRRDAERLSRSVSVQFDSICHEARLKRELVVAGTAVLPQAVEGAERDVSVSADELLANIPIFMRRAASRVIEEQKRNPKEWLNVVKGWQSFYEAMKVGQVPRDAQRPAIEAQAVLNGIELAIQGKPLPPEPRAEGGGGEMLSPTGTGESWASICRRALAKYRDHVGDFRYKLVQRRLPEVKVVSVTPEHVEAGLLEWCRERLNDVAPRTVKTQLDGMARALRCVLPKLQTPYVRELQGVMQPRTDDRESMPVQAIRAAIEGFKQRPASVKVRKGYMGGASQFDAIAVEALAVLGMRPMELMQAKSNAIFEWTDVFGAWGVYFRIANGKNRASVRNIPISNGVRSVLDIEKLREMLVWQECNPRLPHGAVTSLGTRFKKMTGGYTLYQMRHSWKDIAVRRGVDFEVRERLLGHRVQGVAAVYGSGVPLEIGLDAIEVVRSAIVASAKEIDG